MSLAKKLGGKGHRHRWRVGIVYRSHPAVGLAAEDVERCITCNVTRPLRTRGDRQPPWSYWGTK